MGPCTGSRLPAVAGVQAQQALHGTEPEDTLRVAVNGLNELERTTFCRYIGYTGCC